MSLLQLDYIKVANCEGKKSPYESAQVREVVKHCIPLKYGETTDIAPDIRLTFQNAGHILGSAVCHFHIGDGLYNIAFTGDMKFERTWLFNATVNKFPRLETLIIESTYGGYHDIQPSRVEASTQLRDIIERAAGTEGQGRRAGLRRRPFPGGHAGHRGAGPHRQDRQAAGLPGRDDLGGNRDPHRLPRVPELASCAPRYSR